jgi:hypothetical protein
LLLRSQTAGRKRRAGNARVAIAQELYGSHGNSIELRKWNAAAAGRDAPEQTSRVAFIPFRK